MKNAYINENKNYNENYNVTLKKLKDWYIQGFQLNKCYIDDWNEIKSIFTSMGLKIQEHGPIITMNEVKNVRLARQIASEIHGYEKNKVFLTVLYSLPRYCLKTAYPSFLKWIKKEDNNFEKLLVLSGTMKEVDKEVEEIIEDIIFSEK